MSDELYTEISDFAPHSEKLTVSTLLAINQGINVINNSPPGFGKSRCTVDLLEMLNEDYEMVSGRVTPKKFFQKLETVQKGGIMVIDESATLLRNPMIKELLLSALWGGEVTWETSTQQNKIDNFSGTVIFNTNSMSSDAFTQALKDRVLYNELKLSRKQIRDKIISTKTYEPNTNVWNKVKENCRCKFSLNDSQNKAIWKYLSDMKVNSVRDKWRVTTIAKGLNNLFGNIEKLEDFYQQKVEEEDDVGGIIKKLDKTNTTLAEQYKEFSKKIQMSFATFKRYRKRLGLSRGYNEVTKDVEEEMITNKNTTEGEEDNGSMV